MLILRRGVLQARQYGLSVAATCARTRTFALGGYDVALDDVLEPAAFSRYWQPELEELTWKVVILLPSLQETLVRSAQREKRVLEDHTKAQHSRSAEWPPDTRIDTSGQSIEHSLALVVGRLGS